jgi:PhnB protein
MKVDPYLFFNGRCEEAITFYKQAVGAEVTLQLRMNEAPAP